MNWLLIHQLVEWGIRLAMVPVILRRRFLPATALAWLAVIFFLPEIGLFFYMLVGDARLGRKRIRLHQQVIDASRKNGRMLRQKRHITRPRIDRELEPIILQAESIGGMPILGGSQVELLGDTDALFDRLVADIDAAKHHVHLLFYIYAADETGNKVSEALMRAAKRGVTCRLLVDSVGSLAFRRASSMPARLREAGVQVREALPARLWRVMLARIDLRNHRKIAIIDGKIGYTGSHNVVNADYGKGPKGKRLQWIDLSGRYTGPIVHQLQIVFMEDWAFDTGEQLESGADELLPPMDAVGEMAAQTVPTGPSEDDTKLPNVLLAAINAARRKVVVTTPYFVPDEPTLVALLMAAGRGVEVQLILPAKSDHLLVSLAGKFYYEPLLEAGVRIHHFHGGLLHSKTVTVDDAFALLGSTNMDVRSFYLNFELNVLMYGAQITRELRFAQTSYLSEATEVKLAEWAARPMLKRYAATAAALLSPLM